MMVMLERELKLHLCNNIINVIQINNIKTPQIWLSYKIEKCKENQCLCFSHLVRSNTKPFTLKRKKEKKGTSVKIGT